MVSHDEMDLRASGVEKTGTLNDAIGITDASPAGKIVGVAVTENVACGIHDGGVDTGPGEIRKAALRARRLRRGRTQARTPVKIGRASGRERVEIRDDLVTGVQTCALPILRRPGP